MMTRIPTHKVSETIDLDGSLTSHVLVSPRYNHQPLDTPTNPRCELAARRAKVEVSGKEPTLAEELDKLGYTHTGSLAASAKLAVKHSRGTLRGVGDPPSRSEALEYILANADLYTAVKAATPANSTLASSTGGFFYFTFIRIDPRLCKALFNGLALSGVGLSDDSPIYRLREALAAARGGGDGKTKAARREEVLALVIKAWNLLRDGKTGGPLAWDPATEDFPTIR